MWRTNIQKSVTGAEQRSSLFTWARYKMQCHINGMSTKETNWLLRKINKYQAEVWGVPIFQDVTWLTAQASSGQPNLTVESTDNRHFNDDAEILIQDPNDFTSYEIGTVSSFTSTQITLDANLTQTWPANTLIFPLFDARLRTAEELRYRTSHIASLLLVGEGVYEDTTPAASTSASMSYPTYSGYDILDKPPTWSQPPRITFNHPVDVIKGFGLSKVEDVYDQTLWRFRHNYIESEDSLWKLISFFDDKKGRWGAFWLPSWCADIIVTSGFSSTDTTLNIEDIEYSTDWGIADLPGRIICFWFPDGDLIFRRVTALPSSTQITIDSALGKTLSDTEVSQLLVSFAHLVRFDNDHLDLDYVTTKDAKISLSFSTVPQEYT